jgi:RNA polymerase sigma-54 factor
MMFSSAFGGEGPGLSPRITQRMEQRLSPQMVLAMKILQLPALELQQMIKEELETNPTLELNEDNLISLKDKTDEPASSNKEDSPKEIGEADTVKVLDHDRESSPRTNSSSRSDSIDKKWETMQNVADKPESIQDYLYQQFTMLEADEADLEIAKNIIYNIDENGYLKTSAEEIAQISQTTPEKVSELIYIIQQFDPPGIGARNIQECLLLQLTEDTPHLDIEKRIINDYLTDIQNNQLPKVAAALSISMDELKDIVHDISQLNPNPGAGFGKETAPEVVPDIIVTDIDGAYDIKLNKMYVPNLRINLYYQKLLSDPLTPQETKEYIKKKIESANQIIRSIRLRQTTLLRIAEEIIKAQDDFFKQGLSHLRPLKMQDIADKVGVHITTVSRAITSRSFNKEDSKRTGENSRALSTAKYIQTPAGIFSMKFFFSRATDPSADELKSNKVVFMAIKELIDNENKQNPLNDEEIISILKQKNVTMARRTVAKYRQILNIPPARIRKQF